MNLLRAMLLAGALMSLQGCVAAALAVASLAGTAGLDYTLDGITYKTFTEPMDEVQTAIIDTLDRMGMELLDTGEMDEGWEFTAEAHDRTIEIQLEALTDTTTRMRVIANEGDVFFKDNATAEEIIQQVADSLDEAHS